MRPDSKTNTDNIELRSEKVRHIIGKVPPVLVRTGTIIITLVVIAFGVAFYTIHYPITIEAQGEVLPHYTLKIMIPYKYNYLFDKPRMISVTYEGESDNAQPHTYPVASYDRQLVRVGSDNFFITKANISSDNNITQVGQKADVRIIISDKTFWQQVFNHK